MKFIWILVSCSCATSWRLLSEYSQQSQKTTGSAAAPTTRGHSHSDVLVQYRRNYSTLAMELRLSSTNPPILLHILHTLCLPSHCQGIPAMSVSLDLDVVQNVSCIGQGTFRYAAYNLINASA